LRQARSVNFFTSGDLFISGSIYLTADETTTKKQQQKTEEF